MTKITPVLRIPWVLTAEYEAVATRLLQLYFGKDGRGPAFTGALFQKIGGRGDAEEWKNVARAEDALAVAALSVDIPAKAAFALLGDRSEEVTRLLTDIPVGVDLVEEDADVSAESPASRLWYLLRKGVGIGPTTTSKLMARKRPQLIPIYDSVVRDALGLKDSRGHWEGMQRALRGNDKELHHRSVRLRADAGLDSDVSALRVIDVVLWMHGKKRNRSLAIAAELGLPVPDDGPS